MKVAEYRAIQVIWLIEFIAVAYMGGEIGMVSGRLVYIVMVDWGRMCEGNHNGRIGFHRD
jgi:hypothetical protein